MFGGLLALGGLALVIVGAFLAGAAFTDCSAKAAAFERTYATVPGHAVEFLYWSSRHLRQASTVSTARRARLFRAFLALFAAIVTLLLPVVAVAASGAPDLSAHGVAAGTGALVWGLLLETVTLRQRTHDLGGAILLRIELWLFAILLCVADVAALVTVAWVHVEQADLRAATFGIAFVAAADLVSTYLGFILCPWARYPLADP